MIDNSGRIRLVVGCDGFKEKGENVWFAYYQNDNDEWPEAVYFPSDWLDLEIKRLNIELNENYEPPDAPEKLVEFNGQIIRVREYYDWDCAPQCFEATGGFAFLINE